MPVVVISYRDSFEHRCGRGCNCLFNSGASDFAMYAAETDEAAAVYIASRIHEQPDAPFVHLLCNNWEEVASFARSGSFCQDKAEESINIPYMDPTDYPGGYESFDEYEQEQISRGLQHAGIKNRVKEILAEHVAAASRKAAEERERLKRVEEERLKEKRRAEYEKLHLEFGGPPS